MILTIYLHEKNGARHSTYGITIKGQTGLIGNTRYLRIKEHLAGKYPGRWDKRIDH